LTFAQQNDQQKAKSKVKVTP